MGTAETRLQRGDPGFRDASLAMFAAGVATFVLLYATQPLLPLLARDFRVTPADSTLTLALSTAAIALALLPAGWLADAWGRTRVMTLSLLASALLGLAAAAAPNFTVLLMLRTLEGVALAGVPAVGMAYLAEEIHPSSLGSSIGLYIGGNAIGGMLGRLISGAVADGGDWRLALAVVGAVSLACAVVFARLVPASAHHCPQRFSRHQAWSSLSVHLRDVGQLRLELMAALLMGTFVAVYNAVGFRLQAAPYGLGQAALAAIFLVYPIGSFASATAGRLADRLGRRRVLPVGVLIAMTGVAVTALHPLALIILGIALLTVGFFAAHSVASSWVGRRASSDQAQASALYLFAYYAGSSLAGPLGGVAWSGGRWPEVMGLAGILLISALVVSFQLARTKPLTRTVPA